MMKLENLESVRALMLEELEYDVSKDILYRSERLTDHGFTEYPELMRQAIASHDEQWLAHEINRRDLLKSHEIRNTKRGQITAKVPVTAAHTLAEGEFNRYYIRAVCRMSLERGQTTVEVYRAKEVEQPRPESQRRIGALLRADAVLEDLRDKSSVDAVLGVPAGPNSGLSVRLAS
jgi:hypothetical protein